MIFRTQWKTIKLELDTNRFGGAKLIIAGSMIVLFVFFMAKQLVGMVDHIPDSEIKAFVSFAFILVGLVAFLDEE